MTGSGSSALVRERSANGVLTRVVSVALLFAGFASIVALVTAAVFVIVVPSDVPGFTFTTSVKTCGAARAWSVMKLQVTVPVPPEAGLTQVQPAGAVRETIVVEPGTTSVTTTALALSGPAFVTLIV